MNPVGSVNWSAQLETATSAAIGDCMVKDANDLYVLGTTANRAGGIRCDGIALTPYSGMAQGAIALQQAGRVPNAVTNLGVGAISWVRTSAVGRPERCTPVAGDDIIGRCAANGDLSLMPGVLDATLVNGGGTPTGTGLAKVVGGTIAAAASLLVDADVSATAFVAGTKIAPDFGSQNVRTTGYGGFGAATLPTVGVVRLGGGVGAQTLVTFDASGDLCAFAKDGTGNLYIGVTSGGTLQVPATVLNGSTNVQIWTGATSRATFGSTTLQLQDGYAIVFGTTTPPSSGQIRTNLGVTTGAIIRAKSSGGDTDLLSFVANSKWQLGHQTNYDAQIYANSLAIWGGGGTTFFGSDGTQNSQIGSAGHTWSDGKYIQLGTTQPAASGDLRVRQGFIMAGRINAGSADRKLLQWGSSGDDYLYLGDLSNGTNTQISIVNDFILNSTTFGGIFFRASSTGLTTAVPIIGASSPYAVHGGVSHTFAADANYTVTAAQYANDEVEFVTGSWTAGRTTTWPAPASLAKGYYKTIVNRTTFTMTVSTGAGTTRTLAAGFGQRFWFDNSGVQFAGAVYTP